MNLMQTQPVGNSLGAAQQKPKFKQAKPLTNARGKSVPQERPSNSQDSVNMNANGGAQAFGAVNLATGVNGAATGQTHSATKSTSGIRISSQRQQFISSSNKTIKTLKQFNQTSSGRHAQTADTHGAQGQADH